MLTFEEEKNDYKCRYFYKYTRYITLSRELLLETDAMVSSVAPRKDSRGVLLLSFLAFCLSVAPKCSVLVLVTSSTLLAVNTWRKKK